MPKRVLDVDKVFNFQPFKYNESVLEAERYCGPCPDSATWAIRTGHLLESLVEAGYRRGTLKKGP